MRGSTKGGFLVRFTSFMNSTTSYFIATFLSSFFLVVTGNSEQELDIAAFKLTKTYALITFTRPVDLYKCSISLDSTTKFDTNKWQAVDAKPNVKYYSVWKLEDLFELNNEGDSIFDLTFVDEDDNSHSLTISKSNDGLFGIKMPRFGYEFGSGVLNVLQEQLSSCQQLLEYEPDSKCKLTVRFILIRVIQLIVYMKSSHRDSVNSCLTDASHRSQRASFRIAEFLGQIKSA